VLAMIRLGLGLLPLEHLTRVMAYVVQKTLRKFVAGGSLAAHAARAVTRASAYVPRATCLARALAVQALLQRRGCIATLRIGLARGAQRVEGHAWVEVGGSAVFGEGFASEMVLPGFRGGR
jgi:hypothetical protein